MHIQPLCGCVAIYKSSLNTLVDCRVPIFVIVKLIDYFWITWNAPPTVYKICVYNFVCHQCDSDCNWWTCIPVLMAIFPVDLDKPWLWLIGRWAEYCDEHFCLSVCVQVYLQNYVYSEWLNREHHWFDILVYNETDPPGSSTPSSCFIFSLYAESDICC